MGPQQGSLKGITDQLRSGCSGQLTAEEAERRGREWGEWRGVAGSVVHNGWHDQLQPSVSVCGPINLYRSRLAVDKSRAHLGVPPTDHSVLATPSWPQTLPPAHKHYSRSGSTTTLHTLILPEPMKAVLILRSDLAIA